MVQFFKTFSRRLLTPPALVIAFLSAAWVERSSSAAVGPPCQRWESSPLKAQPEGLNGIVECMTVWTPTNGIPLLVAGGNFGGILRAWDGASWDTVGSPFVSFNGPIYAMTVYNNDLIVAGDFTALGNLPLNRIARFDGDDWHPLGSGLEATVQVPFPAGYALTVYNGELIAAGSFQVAGGVNVNHIARWNGTAWSGLSTISGTGVNGPIPEYVTVRALTVLNNILYAGGDFQTAASIPVARIAQWNGTSWASLGGLGAGVNNYVHELSQYGGNLVVAGEFTMAGPSGSMFSAPSIARWTPGAFPNGSWSGMGTLGGTSVYSLQNYNGGVLAGGWSHAGGPNLAFWNGSSWSLFNGGVNGPSTPYFPKVTSLAVFNGNVVLGGWFDRIGQPSPGVGVNVHNVGQWTGSGWSMLWTPPAVINAMATFGNRVVAAGDFVHSTWNASPAIDVIGFDGMTLSKLANGVGGGQGTNGSVLALKSFTLAGPFGGNGLVIGGSFSAVAGMTANNIAFYSESGIAVPAWSTLGSGFNGTVRAIERHNNIIYAGGDFSFSGGTGVSRIAQLSGSNWIALGSGMNGTVYALKSYNGQLYAGGSFTTAGGVSTGGLARWNGTTWSSVGGFFLGTVYALDVSTADNTLVIGGQYTGINNSPNLARYSSTFGYSTFGVGGTNGPVRAVRYHNNSVYIGGAFSAAGGLAANNAARYNYSTGWSGMPSGVNGQVNALMSHQNEVHVGANYTSGWHRYTDNGVPWIHQHPATQSIPCDGAASFWAVPSDIYFGQCTHQWQKDGVPLVDGYTSHGSEISGSDNIAMTVWHATAEDEGVYRCVVSNNCGTVITLNATLTVGECCEGDVNNSGTVNIDDLVQVIIHWGQTGPPNSIPGDANRDGVVDINDLVTVITTWGVCP